MITTLLITIIVEGAMVLAYSSWRRKPPVPILFTSVFANLITQSLLWFGLIFFYRRYLIILYGGEILIWMLESVLLYLYRANQLELKDAVLLSLIMNLASFGLGWFLPV